MADIINLQEHYEAARADVERKRNARLNVGVRAPEAYTVRYFNSKASERSPSSEGAEDILLTNTEIQEFWADEDASEELSLNNKRLNDIVDREA